MLPSHCAFDTFVPHAAQVSNDHDYRMQMLIDSNSLPDHLKWSTLYL